MIRSSAGTIHIQLHLNSRCTSKHGHSLGVAPSKSLCPTTIALGKSFRIIITSSSNLSFCFGVRVSLKRPCSSRPPS